MYLPKRSNCDIIDYVGECGVFLKNSIAIGPMKWIGLTGGLASGKTTVANLLRTKGLPVIDADQIAKDVVALGTPGLSNVIKEFGDDLRRPDGSLDRQRLGEKVFGDPARLLQLENLLHPLVQAEVSRLRANYEKQGHALAFYDVPLLFEKNLTGFDAVVVVSSSEERQRARMKSRNGWSDDEIDRRLSSQIPLKEKVLKATHVIHNDAGLSELETGVDELLKKLRSV
jgi:dephospho-CoA kinase